MIRSLYTGASGLKNHQSKMDTVGNNIANVNTVGYKSTRTTFADILSQNIKGASAANGAVGSTNPTQIGLGTQIASTDLIFKDGAPMMTGKKTDLCLSGDGLFVVRGGNETYYTRDGAFDFDAAGNYVLPGSGHFVQGWMATDSATGSVIDTTGAISDIKISGISAQPTTEIGFQYNLGADSPFVTVGKVKKTEKIWEEVDDIGVLEEEESSYNLNIKIGDNDFILHAVGDRNNHEDDIDLSKKWTVKEVGDYSSWEWPITLEDNEGNTSTIRILPKDSTDIKVGDIFSADTSQLRFKSTVNERSPLDFIVNGRKYKAVKMGHSVEFPGEDWVVSSVNNVGGKTQIIIEQRPNGKHNGCSVDITLDQELEESQFPVLGSALEFSDEALAAPKFRLVTHESEEEAVTVTGDTSSNPVPVTTTVTIYDDVGKAHQVPVYFFHEGESNGGTLQSTNKWLVSLSNDYPVKKGEITSYEYVSADGNKGRITMPVVEIRFDEDGKLLADSDTVGSLTIGGQNITVDFTKVTQYPSETTVTATSNGNASKTLKDIQIDANGMITGIYTDGTRRLEAQVALAHFSNSAGLLKKGTSLYQESDNSGSPVTIKVGEYGTVLTPGALEMSNADLANEFADMIITQRGFQSNAKTITVGDELIETAINMKR